MRDWLQRKRPATGDEAHWTKCPSCGELLYEKELAEHLYVCPKCEHHFRMRAPDRIAMLVDGPFEEIGGAIVTEDPLTWSDRKSYPEKLAADRAKSHLSEAVVTGFTTIGGFGVGLGIMDFAFRGGTMGTVVGERIALLFEAALARSVPVVLFTASGGARMEEGMLALMQMAKTTLAVARFIDGGNFYCSVLTDPTTGGVSASFAFQADVIVAEAGAAIGFAGRRVIEQTIRQKLPENFQTAGFLLEKGHVDAVVPRPALRATLTRYLDYAIGARHPRNAATVPS